MGYELYSISGAPRPWRVMLGFVAKGIDFEIINLEASKQEQKGAPFLALNPRGRVPLLKSGDFVLSESIAILNYLEKLHPTPPLFGTIAAEHARIWQMVSEWEDFGHTATGSLLRAIFFRGQNETSEEVQNGATSVHGEFKRIEEALGRSRFLCGGRITAADCVCFPEVRLVLRAIERFPAMMQELKFHSFEKYYPRLSAWVVRIESLPRYEKTFPVHWKSQ
jgi:glutathione S-transferase